MMSEDGICLVSINNVAYRSKHLELSSFGLVGVCGQQHCTTARSIDGMKVDVMLSDWITVGECNVENVANTASNHRSGNDVVERPRLVALAMVKLNLFDSRIEIDQQTNGII
jgi:hypothetical protein